ncbi:MAG: hypothetical protein U0271_44780 [Polyangiaceae bacterium]
MAKHARNVTAPPNAKVKATHPDPDPDFILPEARVVQCVFYSYNDPGIVPRSYAQVADRLLQEHGLELRLYKSNGACISIPGGQWSDFNDDAQIAAAMVARAKKEVDPGSKFLPVIFCSIVKESNGTGETFPRPTNEKPTSTPGERYILLYVNRPSGDLVTLLHEIGHAAGHRAADGDIHDEWGIGNPDGRYSVMGTPGKVGGLFMGEDGAKNKHDMDNGRWARNTIYRPLVEKIAAAPWTVKASDCQLQRLNFP